MDGGRNILLTGGFSGTCEFVGEPFTANSQTDEDVFVTKLDEDGNKIWARAFGGSHGQDIGQSIVTDGAGNVFVAGMMSNTFTFGNCTANGSLSSDNTFAMKLDSDGTCVWAKGFTGTREARMVATPSGSATVSRTDVSSAPEAMVLTEHAAPSGSTVRESRFLGNATSHMRILDLRVAQDGTAFAAGWYEKSFDLGGHILPSAPTDEAAFAAAFAP